MDATDCKGDYSKIALSNSILQLTPTQRAELFVAANQQNGTGIVILEKDFWVCWTLKELFSLPVIGSNLIFKGGTSLSKVFKVIERFSEDIDVSIDRAFLGFGGSNEPEVGGSKKERQRRIEALKTAFQKKISEELPNISMAPLSKYSSKEGSVSQKNIRAEICGFVFRINRIGICTHTTSF